MRLAVLSAAFCFVGVTGCAYTGTPTAPTPVTTTSTATAGLLRLTASTRPDFSLLMTAEVLTTTGAPVSGQSVTFSTAAGSIAPAAATTDANGFATAIATVTGTVQVSARVAGCASCAADVRVMGGKPADLIPPSVSFGRASQSIDTGSSAVFSLITSGTATPVSWNFGDGSTTTSTSASQLHAYRAAGTYTASVTCRDAQGVTVTASTLVYVTDPIVATVPRPTLSVEFTYPTTPTQYVFLAANEGARFAVRTSVVGSPVAIVYFDFGDGARDEFHNATSFHGYAQRGTYTVTVLVQDGFGRTATATSTVVVY